MTCRAFKTRLLNLYFHLHFQKKNLIGFRCNNAAACTNLWRCAVEQRYFFTMNSSLEIPSVTTGGTGFLFAKQCKLRYR